MAKNIDAKLNNIQGVFSNSGDSVLGKNGVFRIPEYQRAYNWLSNNQCDKLWQDIEAFIENKRNEAYFFGSIIINNLNNNNDEHIVIDGQQRLTTFMVLLKALLIKIDLALEEISQDEESEKLKAGLEERRKQILKCLYSIDEDDIFDIVKGRKKLSCFRIKYDNKSINEEYPKEIETILLGETFSEIECSVIKIPHKQFDNKYSRFFKNFKFFIEKLNSLDITKINTFARTLLEECQVITIISYQTEEAIEIFNSLNSTGLPLADADILSAKLYSNYDENKEQFNARWEKIIRDTTELKNKGISSIDDILNQYMYILRAKYNEKDTTLPGVRRYFTDIHGEVLRDPEGFISDIEKIIEIWQDTGSTTELIDFKQILLKHNNNFKFYYISYLYFKANKSDEEKKNFVEALLRLFAILSITEVGYSSAKFKSFLIGLNMDIGKNAATNELAEKINEHIQKEFRRDEIRQQLIDSNVDKSIVYLNEYLFGKEEGFDVSFDIGDIQIEHIMPASGKNIAVIREDAGMDNYEFRQYVNKIGNKILLEQSINGSISNDWFRTKKQKTVEEKRGYKNSRFPIAKSLTDYDKDGWGKDDIRKATEKAAERIVNFIFK